MSEIDQGGLVYPSGEEVYSGRVDAIHTGITLRQHYAGIALQGIVTAEYGSRVSESTWARDAFRIADAMIEAGKQ